MVATDRGRMRELIWRIAFGEMFQHSRFLVTIEILFLKGGKRCAIALLTLCSLKNHRSF